MKTPRHRLLTIAGFLVCFALGAGIGIIGASYLYYHHFVPCLLDRDADELSKDLDLLAHLQLGEVPQAIARLENSVDGYIVSVALTPHISLNEKRRSILMGAHTYREYYPSQSAHSSQVAQALEGVQCYETFTCDNAFCRLMNAKRSTKTAEDKSTERGRQQTAPANE